MKKMNILIINGPNLNLLGQRETKIYGNSTFKDYFLKLTREFEGIILEYFQSNTEGNIIDKIHECGFSYDGIILNAGGYTHTSVAIRDAISSVTTPVIEVHISNILSRENFRHQSIIGPVCRGCIMGFGLESYRLALLYFLKR
jgi:3-dehydroquinate dehydratase II